MNKGLTKAVGAIALFGVVVSVGYYYWLKKKKSV